MLPLLLLCHIYGKETACSKIQAIFIVHDFGDTLSSSSVTLGHLVA